MNYMKKVAEMFGVEMGKKFKIKGKHASPSCDYAFTEKGLIAYCKPEGDVTTGWLEDLMTGDAEIINKPWKPKKGEKYFYFKQGGSFTDNPYYVSAWNWSEDIVDLSLFAMGNCFPSEAEAEAHRAEVTTLYDDILEGLNK